MNNLFEDRFDIDYYNNNNIKKLLYDYDPENYTGPVDGLIAKNYIDFYQVYLKYNRNVDNIDQRITGFGFRDCVIDLSKFVPDSDIEEFVLDSLEILNCTILCHENLKYFKIMSNFKISENTIKIELPEEFIKKLDGISTLYIDDTSVIHKFPHVVDILSIGYTGLVSKPVINLQNNKTYNSIFITKYFSNKFNLEININAEQVIINKIKRTQPLKQNIDLKLTGNNIIIKKNSL